MSSNSLTRRENERPTLYATAAAMALGIAGIVLYQAGGGVIGALIGAIAGYFIGRFKPEHGHSR